MTGIQRDIQSLIKKQRFTLNTMDEQTRWREGKMDLTYRITWVDSAPWDTRINIMVKGNIEDKKMYDHTPENKMVAATDAVYAPKEDWGETWKRRSMIWGDQYHKEIRKSIRGDVLENLRNFFKLIGITENIYVDKVNFEK